MKLIIDREYNITGRGQVFTLKLSENGLSTEVEKHKNVISLGKEVEINDVKYQIRGIEAFKTMDGSISDSIGLLVKPL